MTRRMPALLLAALLPLAACGASGAAPRQAALTPPADMGQGAGDPMNAALLHASYAFGAPGRLAGRPAEAARAAAELELLAANLPHEPRWIPMNPVIPGYLAQGRGELRNALGVPAEAPAQQVMDSLWAAGRAQASGNATAAAAALPPSLFPAGGSQTMTRLANLPPLPRASTGLQLAQQEMTRLMRDVVDD